MIISLLWIATWFACSVAASTIIIRGVLLRPQTKTRSEEEPCLPLSGFWIGFFETVLIFVFVLEQEYIPVAVLLGAKILVGSRPGVRGETAHTRLLLGSLINGSVAVLFALIARVWTTKLLMIMLV